MERSLIYNGTITAEQFLFYEIRISTKYYLKGVAVEDSEPLSRDDRTEHHSPVPRGQRAQYP